MCSTKMSLKIDSLPLSEICAHFGVTENVLDEYRQKFQEWLAMQPHLPKNASKFRLENLIIACKFSLEVAKQKLDLYYRMKSLAPELFQKRDPRSHGLQSACEHITWVTVPKLTPDGCNLSIFTVAKADSSGLSWTDLIRLLLLNCEIRMMEYRYSLGDVVVIDMKDYNLGYVLKTNPSSTKTFFTIAMNAIGARMKGVHYINCPPYADRVIGIVKSVLKAKLHQRIHVHKDMESLYQVVPKSMMPKDYGGDEMSLKELQDLWLQKYEECRDWLIEEDKFLIDEKLRPGRPVDNDEVCGIAGSFRKLDID